MTTDTPRAAWSVPLDPLLMVSALIALSYGIWAPGVYALSNPPLPAITVWKAAPVFLLSARALFARSRLLCAGLLFGCVGDAFLVWPDKVAHGALAFLIGHLYYIALFLRAGVGVRAAMSQPPRLLAALAIIVAAVGMSALLGAPRDHALFVPLGIYTGVLTLMTLSSFTLPASRWLAMLGAVLFFVSDGFVAAHMFHPIADPTLAYWSNFAGWMLYWAGQAGICYGALGLHRTAPA